MKLYFDVECYRNYFLVMFMNEQGKTKSFEMHEFSPLDVAGLKRYLSSDNELISFNGNKYDLPVIYYATKIANTWDQCDVCDWVKAVSDEIILADMTPWALEKKYDFKIPKLNHIDLIELAPGIASLKIYGGRLHVKKLQDLPIEPHATLTRAEMEQLRLYCRNDLLVTQKLEQTLKGEIALRRTMSGEYETDLRSKSDAQIAEAVLKVEVKKHTGLTPAKLKHKYHDFLYQPPAYLKFRTAQLQQAFATVCSSPMIVQANGYVLMPDAIDKLAIQIGGTRYKMGIGGLHSQESEIAHFSNDDTELIDRDVVSYYPNLMLNQGLFPPSMGEDFLSVYRKILDERVTAKHAGDKVKADTLKIVLNGTYGKTSSVYSILYNPVMMIQTTLTGQLSLLMLIELLESAGIAVVSANTDGIVMRRPKALAAKADRIIGIWEKLANLETEETRYARTYSRDVNNYIAVYATPKQNKDGSFTYVKTKGVYGDSGIRKNPTNDICSEAVVDHLVHGKPIEATIRGCTDVTKFISLRTVKGGAEKPGYVLGKAIRWYYAVGVEGTIKYKLNGNDVPRTEGAKPLMELPDVLPDDIDYKWYIREANNMLMDVGAVVRPPVVKLPRKNSKDWKALVESGQILLNSKGDGRWKE